MENMSLSDALKQSSSWPNSPITPQLVASCAVCCCGMLLWYASVVWCADVVHCVCCAVSCCTDANMIVALVQAKFGRAGSSLSQQQQEALSAQDTLQVHI